LPARDSQCEPAANFLRFSELFDVALKEPSAFGAALAPTQ
jgi:hypothetical protein